MRETFRSAERAGDSVGELRAGTQSTAEYYQMKYSQLENSILFALVEIEIIDRVHSVPQCYHNVHQTFFVISGTRVSPSVLGRG